MNQLKQTLFALALTFGMIVPMVSHAALPEGVTTAITGAGTDIAAAGALILAVIIGIKVFKWIQRVF